MERMRSLCAPRVFCEVCWVGPVCPDGFNIEDIILAQINLTQTVSPRSHRTHRGSTQAPQDTGGLSPARLRGHRGSTQAPQDIGGLSQARLRGHRGSTLPCDCSRLLWRGFGNYSGTPGTSVSFSTQSAAFHKLQG